MAKKDNTVDQTLIQYQIGPKTTLAKHDSAHCLVPGLFRSLKRGDHQKQKLHITYKFGEKQLIEFKGPEPLGADDLVVFQGLLAMAGLEKIFLRPTDPHKLALSLRKKLELKWDALEDTTLVVASSFRKLAREIGYDPDSGGALKGLQECVERLWTVSVIVQNGNIRQGFKMLSFYASDFKRGKLMIALNPRVAEAVFGKGPYTRINMDEVRKLKSGPARILHQRLCAIISQGQSKKIFPDTMMGYIWPDPVDGSAKRRRMMTLRKSLAEIQATGAWEIEPGYVIKRKGNFKKKAIKKKKVN